MLSPFDSTIDSYLSIYIRSFESSDTRDLRKMETFSLIHFTRKVNFHL